MKNWKSSLLGLALLGLSAGTIAAPQELDRVVTIVNDSVILQSDVDAMMKTVRMNAAGQSQPLPPDSVLSQQVMDQLIMETLQLQQAKQFGIRVDDTRLDQAIAQIAKERKMTLPQLQQLLARNGISYAMFREQVRRDITASEARTIQVRRRINILPQEVETLANQLSQQEQQGVRYNISHIQLRLEDGATAQEREKVSDEAKELVKELKKGADFANLAYSYSKGPKALQGGEWGWMRKEEMPTIFADQITSQGKGAIIGPFRSGVGYHILKINSTEGLETVSVTEVNARHILVKTSVILSDDAAKKELEEARQDILSGKRTFADVAQSLSADPGSAANGGKLGWQTPDLYVPEFKNKVESLPTGVISEPFKTVHGWHIVEVMGRRDVDRTDAAVKNRAYRILFNRKFNEEAQAWLQELRAGAFIEQPEDANDQG
ncbi:peptidylprolyl isomerase SurA [Photobacterium aphoticum]|uniref:Chaperone SurA n=1 Tax=Photobacterium aphoticum TaxID=754436 RepID=A0A0J1GGE4_9GAMM|nr:peptidylprolyl isomerase SurA [Photobacterium aphoticum]KLU98772.1 peptidylprolyl isomerase [Photobacterium aphoticum]PSU55411.1 peptidylprolyl isomerase SurA [Photobacterium aphoticum]GHA65261.1 chaperone SurA [Photobacterium aphoticum]